MNKTNYQEKYLKYKNKYLKLKLFGGAKNPDEYTACEIENKLLIKPSKVLLYTMQFPNEYRYKFLSDDIYKIGLDEINISKLKSIYPEFYILLTGKDEMGNVKIEESNMLYIDRVHATLDDIKLTSKLYTHNFGTDAAKTVEEIIKQLQLFNNHNRPILIFRNASVGFALTIYTKDQTLKYALTKERTEKEGILYPYLSSTERNPEYMKYFLSKKKSAETRGPGASVLGYLKYYKKLGISDENIKIVFNTDTEEFKKKVFSTLDDKSHVVIIGHCCSRLGGISSDNPVIRVQDGSTIVNEDLTVEKIISYLLSIPKNPRSNKSVLLNLNICSGYQEFVLTKLIPSLNDETIKPLIISKTEIVFSLAGLSTPVIENNIFNHTCNTPTMITFWNEKLGYTSVNANIFNVDMTTIFSFDNDLMA